MAPPCFTNEDSLCSCGLFPASAGHEEGCLFVDLRHGGGGAKELRAIRRREREREDALAGLIAVARQAVEQGPHARRCRAMRLGCADRCDCWKSALGAAIARHFRAADA
jgi:hypothetical protein